MRLYYGGYGHHPSGKQYVYWGDDNMRTGQNVVAPVTHWKSGKSYNTMFTIMRTSGSDSKMAQGEKERLEEGGVDFRGEETPGGINIKHIEGRNVLDLPGAKKAGYETKVEWSRDSNSRYRDSVNERLSNNSLLKETQKGTDIARNRLMEA